MKKKRARGGNAAPGAGFGPERLQKILARAGYGSRRSCEVLIQEGRVKVDGEVVTELGAKADSSAQEVRVDNRPVRVERPVYYLLNKPKGTLCTLDDPEGRRTVQDHVPDERRRIFPVGRLDMDSRGAVILTNDGNFTNLLTHPRYGVEKTYLARVRGNVTDAAIAKLRAGVWLAEGKTLPARVWVMNRKADETDLGIAISEGKNRQVRRMLAAVNYKCLALTRTRIGPITLKGLREGDHRELTRDEVEELERIARRNAGAPPPPWAKGRSSRARAKGKPDPVLAHDETARREVPLEGLPGATAHGHRARGVAHPIAADDLEGEDEPVAAPAPRAPGDSPRRAPARPPRPAARPGPRPAPRPESRGRARPERGRGPKPGSGGRRGRSR